MAAPLASGRETAESSPNASPGKAAIHAALETFVLVLGLIVVAITIMGESTFHQLAVVISFVVVFFLGKALFERLGNVSNVGGGTFPRLVNFAATSGIGIAMLFGLDWIMEYVGRIGVGVAMVLGILAAYLAVAWQQRWHERRLYRETLSSPSQGEHP
ncbi:MAG: hypothetical protein F4029_17995 [Gammaproteobacteria bacterium]|nr:hypothetical protein [Gammaproteobacteria bacterium]MYK48109.1 hypothetical protein [Gammaproteobacteria bacterium]